MSKKKKEIGFDYIGDEFGTVYHFGIGDAIAIILFLIAVGSVIEYFAG